MLGVGGVTFIAIDRNLRISLWAGRFGVEVGVVEEGLGGGGELVEGAMELLFLINVHCLLLNEL